MPQPNSSPPLDSRDDHLFACLVRSAIAGGMVVTDCVPGLFSVGLLSSPTLPSAAAVAAFDRVLCPSAEIADRIGPKARVFSPPIDPAMLAFDRSRASWLDWNSSDYRVYTVLPKTEIGRVYPLVSRFLREFRSTDAVSLTIRSTADRDDVVRAVAAVRGESNVPETLQARVRINCGPWQAWEQALLAVWGDCCLLPWAGADFPVEATYAMAAGKFVAVTGWSSGSVTPGVGVPIDFRVDDTGDEGPHAVPDWEQITSVLRVAVANGKREHFPARRAGEFNFCENPDFWPKVMSKLGAPADFYDRGKSCLIRSSSPALTLAVLGRSNVSSPVALGLSPAFRGTT